LDTRVTDRQTEEIHAESLDSCASRHRAGKLRRHADRLVNISSNGPLQLRFLPGYLSPLVFDVRFRLLIGTYCVPPSLRVGERKPKLATEYFHQVLKEVEPELAKQNPDQSVPYLAADSYSGLGDLELRMARQSHGDRATRRIE
jgi:hypothetical protein